MTKPLAAIVATTMLAGCVSVPSSLLSGITPTATVSVDSQTGAISISMQLSPKKTATQGLYRAQALPANTKTVTITVTSEHLANPLSQTITADQFVDGKAAMQIAKLPAGQVTVSGSVSDDKGSTITMQGATATIVQGQITPITLKLLIKGPTGTAIIAIDSQEVFEAPVITVLHNPWATKSIDLTPPASSDTKPQWVQAAKMYAGQVLHFQTTGRVGYSFDWGSNWSYTDADGQMLGLFGGFILSEPQMKLVGRFEGNGASFNIPIGVSKDFKAGTDGTFYLGINTFINDAKITTTPRMGLFAGSYSVVITEPVPVPSN